MNRIAIHSVPRSGSTWLGSIFDSSPKVIYKYQPLFSYAFKGFLDAFSEKERITEFFRMLVDTHDPFVDQLEAKKKHIVPNFQKRRRPQMVVYKEVRYHHIISNLLEKDEEIKVVGLVRNPLSVIHSWWRAPKEFRKEQGWNIEEEWRLAQKKNLGKPEEFNGYEKWKEVSLLFEQLKDQYPDRFYLLKYDDLLQNTLVAVKELFDFIRLDFSNQTETFLKESRSVSVQDAYSVFKQKEKDDNWKNDLPKEIIQYIDNDLRGTTLEKYLI